MRDGAVVRTCFHTNSAVIAPRTSQLFGEGGAREVGLLERLLLAIFRRR